MKESQAHLPLAECTEQALGGVLEVDNLFCLFRETMYSTPSTMV